MAIRPLNSVAGFSVGETPANIILANGDITTTNITTTGVSNLNSVGNVKISGGTAGQVISTDGAGNLSFITIGTASLNNGTSNVTVLNSGNILFSVGGTANVGTVTSTGINVSGYLTATGNITGGNANLGNAATANYFIGSGNNLSNIQGANVSGAVAYATTANSVAGANVSGEVSFAATANSVAGANVSGTVANANYSAYAGNVVNSSQSNITSLGTLTTLNVNSTVNAVSFFANASTGTAPLVVASTTKVANLNADLLDGYDTATANTASTVVVRDTNGNVSANFFIGNGSQLTGLPSGTSIANGNSNVSAGTANGNITVSVAGNANVVVFTDTGVNIAGTLNATGNANVGNIGATRGVFTNIAGEGGNISNIQGANVSGTVSSATTATTAGTVTTAAQPNITSTGVLSNLVVANTIYADGYAARTGSDLTLSTAGNGNLIISTAGTGITDFSGKPVSNISTLGVTSNVTAGNVYANSGTIGAQTLKGEGGNISNIQGANVSGAVASATAATNAAAVLNNVATTGTVYPTFISSTANGNYSLTSNTAYTANIANGFLGATLLGGTLTTAAQPNVTSLGTLTSLDVTGNITSSANLISDNILGRTGALTITSAGTNTNINLKPNGTGNIDANSTYITNVKDPSSAQDAATKQYVDNLASTAIAYHEPVVVATTTTLATATGGTTAYNSPNGAANGIGAYISTTGTFNLIDGANVQTAGTRILVKNEANAAWNGVYTYTNATAITRSTDTDEYGPNSAEQLSINDYFFVQAGSVNKGASYIVNAPTGTITFGTSLITFAEFSTSQVYSAGTGLTLANTTFSISNTAVTSGSYGNGDAVATFTVNSQGQLTAASNTAITANAANLTGTTLASTIVNSSLTSVGTLGSLAVTANITAGNVYANSGTIGAQTLKGEGGNISNIQGGNVSGAVAFATTANSVAGANVSGQVANALVAGTVYTAAQPNITSVGTLTTLSVSGNISSGNISGTNGNLTTANISGNVILGNATVTTQITWASVTTSSTSANQTIASLSATGITGVEYLVKAVDATGSKYSVASVIAVTDGSSVDYSTYGTVQLGGYTGSLAVNIVGGDLRLQVTPASSNSTVWTTQYRLI